MTLLKDALALTPWRDTEGSLRPDATVPATAPDFTTFRGSMNGYAMDANDVLHAVFHIPHDWIAGSDIYIHLHWGHTLATTPTPNDTNTVDCHVTYANRNAAPPYAAFPAEVSGSISVTGITIVNYPQYCHVVSEILLATSGGVGALLDSDNLETDGLLLVAFEQTAVPSGMTPFIFEADLHYQSDGSGTLNKDPDYDA